MTDKVIPLAYNPAEPLTVETQDSSDSHSIKSNDSLSNIGHSPSKTKEALNLFQVKSNLTYFFVNLSNFFIFLCCFIF